MLLSVIELDPITATRSMTSDEIEATLIPDFERAFGEQQAVKVELKATPLDGLHSDYHPRTKIRAYDSIFTFRADVHIKNPYDESVDAAVFSCFFNASLNFRIDKKFKIFMQADDLDMTILELNKNFKTSANMGNLNDRLHLIEPLIISYLNFELDKGFQIPMPTDIVKCLKEPRVREYDGYLFIDADPDFTDCFEVTEAKFEKTSKRMLQQAPDGASVIQSKIEEIKLQNN